MDKLIAIDGKEVGFKASALTPRLYRAWLNRDMIVDMNKLVKAHNRAKEDNTQPLSINELTIFENVSWVMAKHYNNSIPNSPEEWLDTFQMFSVWEILPQILELWGLNNATTSEAKKK